MTEAEVKANRGKRVKINGTEWTGYGRLGAMSRGVEEVWVECDDGQSIRVPYEMIERVAENPLPLPG